MEKGDGYIGVCRNAHNFVLKLLSALSLIGKKLLLSLKREYYLVLVWQSDGRAMGLLLVRTFKVSPEPVKAPNGIVSILRDLHIGRERFSCMFLYTLLYAATLTLSLLSSFPLHLLLIHIPAFKTGIYDTSCIYIPAPLINFALRACKWLHFCS